MTSEMVIHSYHYTNAFTTEYPGWPISLKNHTKKYP